MSGDRYAWKGMVYTQELVNYLKSAKKELQDLNQISCIQLRTATHMGRRTVRRAPAR